MFEITNLIMNSDPVLHVNNNRVNPTLTANILEWCLNQNIKSLLNKVSKVMRNKASTNPSTSNTNHNL